MRQFSLSLEEFEALKDEVYPPVAFHEYYHTANTQLGQSPSLSTTARLATFHP
jgi:hypothetical protein